MAQRHAKRRLELTLAICSPKSREKGHLCRHRRASARPRARRRRLVSLPTGCVIGAGFQRLWASVYQEGKLAFTQEASAALPGLNLLCFWEKLQETTGRSRSRISVGGYKDEFCVLLGPPGGHSWERRAGDNDTRNTNITKRGPSVRLPHDKG